MHSQPIIKYNFDHEGARSDTRGYKSAVMVAINVDKPAEQFAGTSLTKFF